MGDSECWCDPYTAVMSSEAILTLTPDAYEMVVAAWQNEDQHESLALWVEVTGVKGVGYTYDLYFQDRDGHDEDVVLTFDKDLPIVIPSQSAPRLRGARLELNGENGGLVLVNPNSPTPDEMAPGVPAHVLEKGLDGDLAKRALAILDAQINPAIASHGGRADLVAMDDDAFVAYVRLSGGCQGCAMSRMTLSQGIEGTLKEEIPELVSVVDVTDHASGLNPFYGNE